MPDHIVQTYHDNDGKARESVHPYQSVWMAHWIRKCCNSTSKVHGHFDLQGGSKIEDWDTKQGPMLVQATDPKKATSLDRDLSPADILENGNAWRFQQGDLEVASDDPNYAKADRVEFGGAKITNETLAVNSTNVGNAKSECQSFPMFSFNQKTDGDFTSKEDLAVYNIYASRSQTDDNSGHVTKTVGTSGPNFPSTDYRFQPESVSQSNVKLPNGNRSFERKSLPLLRHSQDDLTGSSSDVVSYVFKSGGKPVQSFMYRNEEIDQSRIAVSSKVNTNFTSMDYEHCNYNGYSTFLVCDKKVHSQVVGKNSESECSYLGQKDGILQQHDPSVNNFHFPVSVGEQSKTKCRFSDTVFSPSYNTPPGVTKLDELNHGCHFLHRMPTYSVHDVETVKICTIVDSVEHLPGDHLKLSLKSHQFSIIDKIDANSSKQNQMIRQTSSSTDIKRNTFHEFPSIPHNYDCHDKRGAEVQSLGNPSHSGSRQDNGDINTGPLGLKNESSAETDIMDDDAFQEKNSFPGSSSSNKILQDFMVDQNPAESQATVVLPREKNESRKVAIKLPDLNQGSPVFVVEEESIDNKDLNTSRTESLDLEHVSHVEHLEYSNSNAQQDVLGLQSSRWVKRLKLSASDSLARGTKSSKIEDASSSGKVAKLFRKNMNYSRSSSESTLSKCHGNGKMEMDKSMVLLKDKESLYMDSVKDHLDPTLSHPWIQRLCRIRAVAPRPKSAAPVVCEPQSSMAALDKFQRKQFPSIAAMALMGKATNCFQPCRFKKRSSVIVWKTDEF